MKRKKILQFGLVFSLIVLPVLVFNGCNNPTTPEQEVKPILYTVNFSLNDADVTGANGIPDVITDLSNGAIISLPGIVPSSDSHDFDGWFKEPECINPWDFTSDTVTETITLYAKWILKTPAIPIINIDFVYSWDNEKNKIVIIGDKNIISYGESILISGPGSAEYTNWVWKVNGVTDNSGEGTAEYTFNSLGRSPGSYTIDLLTEFNGQWYSAAIVIVIEGGEQ